MPIPARNLPANTRRLTQKHAAPNPSNSACPNPNNAGGKEAAAHTSRTS